MTSGDAMTPREIRQHAGLTVIAAAVGAGTAEGTTRLYEANRDAVSQRSRTKLDAFYAGLRARLEPTEVRAS
jgi:hypothetical protein